MLNRRHFIRNTSLAFSGLMLGSCNLSGSSPAKRQKISPIAEKARNALLAMQRASWEQGTFTEAQAFLLMMPAAEEKLAG